MAEQNEKTCFMVMPMSDGDPYPPNHWDHVYKELFVPACEKAEFKVDRASTPAERRTHLYRAAGYR